MMTLEGLLESIIPQWLRKFISRKSNREKLKEKCGDKAFLLPQSLKFPVMGPDCKYKCSLLFAAYLRAREYGYDSIAERAADLYNKMKCSDKMNIHIHDED